MNNNFHSICMPDELYVGRIYNLYALPKYNVIPRYNYSIIGTNIEKISPTTIKILDEGKITVTAKYIDEDGEEFLCQKEIECKQFPSIERKIVHWTFSTVETLKQMIESATEPTEFILDEDCEIIIDETIEVPYGCVLNFNWKNVKIGSSVVENKIIFLFNHDFCGVENLKLYSTFPSWSNHTGDKYLQAHTLFRFDYGDFCYFKNYVCVNRQNFIISFGRSIPMTNSYNKANTWLDGEIASGYIDENGNIQEDEEAYYSTNYINIPVDDRNFYQVGFFDGFIKGKSKTYAISFYDSDDVFIETKYSQQFFRPYQKPENASKCKLMLWSDELPTSNTGMDWSCYLFITKGFCCRELTIKNCRCLENESGILDFVGNIKEVNIERVISKTGKTNGWAMDFEDGWMAMGDVIIKSCLIQYIPIHSVQGITCINSFLSGGYFNSWANGITMQNCITGTGPETWANKDKITSKCLFILVKFLAKGALSTTSDLVILDNCTEVENNDVKTAYNYAYWN